MAMSAYNPVLQFLDEFGKPLAGGFLNTFVAGTSTPVSTLANEAGARNPVSIPLNSRGECVVFLEDGMHYKFVLVNKFGGVVWTADNVRSSLQFDVVGNDQIEVMTTMVDGKKILTISINPNSIGREQLTNAHNLVPDARYLQFKDFNGNVVVTLSDSLMEWLETEGYTP